MRISSMTARLQRARLPLVALFALTLAACGSVEDTNEAVENTLFRHGNWEQLQGGYTNRVEQVGVEHAVSFAADRAELDPVERRRLVSFLQSSNIGEQDEVTLIAGQAGGPLAAARTAYLKEELGAFGVSARSGSYSGQHMAPADNQMTILVDRWVVITPDCTQPQPAPGNRPRMTPGCADVANFGMQIADPRDLAQGRPLGPADGDRLGRAVDGYRTGEREYLPTVYDTEATSSTGNKL
jgi:pilus biogenesis lipoprotein CpaD